MADSKKTPVILIAVLIAGFAVIPVVGILAALAIYGVRKYIVNAKMAEGRMEGAVLMKGIVTCYSRSAKLPASSRPVPSSLASVSGMKYMSAPAEWSSDAAYSCAGFSMSDPQYFQYRWIRDTPTSGHVVALADLDGDGSPEHEIRYGVTCPSGTCHITTLVDH